MKFTVKSNDLKNAINKVITVTPTRSTLPILGNLYFNLEGKELTIMGTDLEVYIEVRMDVEGKSDGSVAIPAKRLETLLNELSGKELSFDLQYNYNLVIETKGRKWTITGEGPEDCVRTAEMVDTMASEIDNR